MKKPHKYSQNKGLALMILLFISVLGIQSTYAVQISLGNMVTSNRTGNPDQYPDWNLSHAFDGRIGTFEGYSTNGAETIINWDVNPFSRLNLDANQQVDSYTYSITLHSGLSSDYNLNNFSFSYSNGISTSNTIVTTFNSLTSNNGGTITSNAEGLVSASTSSVLAQHTVSFNVGSDIQSITLNIPSAAGQSGPNGNWVLSEITGTVTAEVSQIPEPSTYTLLIGFISLVVIAFKKRIKA